MLGAKLSATSISILLIKFIKFIKFIIILLQSYKRVMYI